MIQNPRTTSMTPPDRRWPLVSIRRFLIIALICAIACALPEVALAQIQIPKWASDGATTTDELIRGIAAADDPGTVWAAYKNLFKKVGPEGVRGLLTHRNDSIALRAAWEVVNASVPEPPPRHTVDVDRQKLEWFIGFVEGRARVRSPEWWKQAMLKSKANRRDNLFPDMPITGLYHDAGVDFAKAPRDTTLERKDGRLFVRIAQDTMAIPDELVSKDDAGKLYNSISALFTKSRCYLALHDDVGYPYTLACLDRSSGIVKWKADAWGCFVGGASGQHFGYVSVTEQDDRIVVFGCSTTGWHMEGFRSDDGKNLFRVSNGN